MQVLIVIPLYNEKDPRHEIVSRVFVTPYLKVKETILVDNRAREIYGVIKYGLVR